MMGEGLLWYTGCQGNEIGVSERLDGQMVVLVGWEALGSVQILHNHPLGVGFDGQGCVYDWDHRPSLY